MTMMMAREMMCKLVRDGGFLEGVCGISSRVSKKQHAIIWHIDKLKRRKLISHELTRSILHSLMLPRESKTALMS